MTLDEQYQKTIDDQRAHLLKLQTDFNAVCDKAQAVAQEKLKTPSLDAAAKEAILQEQKATLDEALRALKAEVEHSTKATMRALEAILREKEKQVLLNLENQIAKL